MNRSPRREIGYRPSDRVDRYASEIARLSRLQIQTGGTGLRELDVYNATQCQTGPRKRKVVNDIVRRGNQERQIVVSGGLGCDLHHKVAVFIRHWPGGDINIFGLHGQACEHLVH